jgi:predicted metal-dependent phosphoesterase TrpH
MPYCDLHMHSTASDGTDSPAALPALAAAAGLSAIALTDHDTTAGLAACADACRRQGIAFCPGIEISADRHSPALAHPGPSVEPGRGSLHILGLFVRHDDPNLLTIARQLIDAREERNPRIIQKLNDLGVAITYDQVQAVAAEQSGSVKIVGRPHIAQVMVEKGYAKTIQDAFSRYLGGGKPAYVRKDYLPPDQAIAAIHHAGGLAILAHPVQLRCADDHDLEFVIRRLQDAGLDAMETLHCEHTPANAQRFAALAERLHLLPSGGSDYHGSHKTVAMGSQHVPLKFFEDLQRAWQRRNQDCPKATT